MTSFESMLSLIPLISTIDLIHGTKLDLLIARNFPDLLPTVLPSSVFFHDERQLNFTQSTSSPLRFNYVMVFDGFFLAGEDVFLYPSIEDLFPSAPKDFTIVDLAPTYRLSWHLNDDRMSYFAMRVASHTKLIEFIFHRKRDHLCPPGQVRRMDRYRI